MVSIKWCLAKEHGLELVEASPNMSKSYQGMAEESIKILENVKESKIWTATTTYYIFYYSLYAVMMKIGVKCEIHTCSLEFMEQCLMELYTPKDVENIWSAFRARSDLQYYANRPVEEVTIEKNKHSCREFYVKSRDIMMKLSEEQIIRIRSLLKKYENLKEET